MFKLSVLRFIILFLSMMGVFSSQAQANAISGFVSNNTGVVGNLFVEIFTSPQYISPINGQFLGPVASASFQFGSTLNPLADGTYYLRASVDTALNGPTVTAGEPFAVSAPVVILGGVPQSGIILDILNALPTAGAAGDIYTIAGGGIGNPFAEGIPAWDAAVDVLEMAADQYGNLYFSDRFAGFDRVRKIDVHGIITTVVGNGFLIPFFGDGGLAINASIMNPRDLAVDSLGNLYISELGIDAVRKVDVNGIITTVVGDPYGAIPQIPFFGDGGLATQASILGPRSLAFDAADNLYIAESGNNAIRKVSPFGIITTVVGGNGPLFAPVLTGMPASTGISGVRYMDVDSFGRLYFEDYDRIITVDNMVDYAVSFAFLPPSGTLRVVAGNWSPGFAGDGFPALDAAFFKINDIKVDRSGHVYVSDSFNNRIRKVDMFTGLVSTVAGNGVQNLDPLLNGDGGLAVNAELGLIRALAIDGLNNIYIADGDFFRIRKVTGDANAALTPPNSISGTVVYANGLPAVDAYVTAYPSAPDPVTGLWGQPVSSYTTGLGQYLLLGLLPGSYDIFIEYFNPTTGFWSTLFPNGDQGGPIDAYGQIIGINPPAQFIVLQGQALTNVNAQLYNPTLGTSISGVITGANGLPVVNAYVTTLGSGGAIDPVTGLPGLPVSAVTDVHGQYTLQGLMPGTYDIWVDFLDPITGFRSPVFPNGDRGGPIDVYGQIVYAAPIAHFTVAQGQALTGVNAQLYNPAVGTSISGVITGANGLPVIDAYVTAFTPDINPVTGFLIAPVSVVTDIYGQYSFQNMVPAVYDIFVDYLDPVTGARSLIFPNGDLGGPIDAYGQIAGANPPAQFSVLQGQVLTNVNAQLYNPAFGTSISGVITSANGLPVIDAYVTAFTPDINPVTGFLIAPVSVVTDIYGQYSFQNMVPAVYDIFVDYLDPVTGARSLIFPNGDLGGPIDAYGQIAGANPPAQFSVLQGQVLTNVNAQLYNPTFGSSISGAIIGSSGLPVIDAYVTAVDLNAAINPLTGLPTASRVSVPTDIYGQYKFQALIPSTYEIWVGYLNPVTGVPDFVFPSGDLGGQIDAYGQIAQLTPPAQFIVAPGQALIGVNAQLAVALPVSVSGVAINNSGQVGSVLVGLSTDPYGLGLTLGLGAVADIYGNYVIQGVPDGVYYVFAYVDVNGNNAPTGPDMNESSGGGNQVTIAGASVSDINMTINLYLDSDGDGVGDYWDIYPANPAYALEPDSDGDGLADVWELLYFPDLITANQFTDANGNGVLDIQEFNTGSNPIAVALKQSFFGVNATGPIMSVVDSTGAAVATPVVFFNASATSFAGVPIDIDGDGVNEYAVVALRADGLIMCQVRRANGVLVKAFFVTVGTQASVLNVYAAQMDAVAGQELVIGKVRLVDNRPVVAVHNPTTGTKTMETFMLNGNWTPSNFFPVDVNGDGIKEIALGAVKLNGLTPSFIPVNRPGIQIRNADGTMSGYVFPMSKDFTGVQYARIDRNGDGIDEIVALGLSVNSRWALQVLNASSATQLSLNIILDTPYTPVSLLTGNVDGIIGDEVVIAASLTSNGRAMFDIRNATSNARINLLYMQPAATVPDQYVLSDWNGDGVQDLMVRGTNTGVSNYLIKRSDNTVVYNGLPAGISGINERYTGGM